MDDPTREDMNPEELDGLAEILLAQDPEDDGYDAAQGVFRPEHPRWRTFIERGTTEYGTIKHRSKLEERKLTSLHTETELKQLEHHYISEPDLSKYVSDELTQSTIAWNQDASLLLVYLKDQIPLRLRNRAQEALDVMIFPDPTRAETKGATKFNAQLGPVTVRAGELLFGFMDRGYIRMTNPTREQEWEYGQVKQLLWKLNAQFARILPADYARQNREIPAEFRQFGTAFSNVSILKSAPASVHKDAGNGLSLTCMTTVSQDATGGEFCLLEYGLKIPVRPGDVLIAATCREWHVNLTPVRGTKYSIIAYFRRGLASPIRLEEWRRQNNT